MAGEKVLVIDDNATVREVVQRVLTGAGWEVDVAVDGGAGLEHARAHKPDLVLLDVVMPGLNGYQVCRALAEIDGLKDVPVVLMSQQARPDPRALASLGLVEHLQKPFTAEALIGRVRATLARYAPATNGAVSGANAAEATAPVELPSAAAQHAAALAEVRARLAEAEGVDVAMLRARLDDAKLTRALAPYVRTMRALDADAAALEGHVGEVPLAEVLALLSAQRQSGVLVIERAVSAADAAAGERGVENGRLVVALRDGAVLYAEAEGLPDAPRTGGDADEQLALRHASEERLYDALGWRAGRFVFRAGAAPSAAAARAALGLSLDAILVGGLRRAGEWHRLERELDLDTVLVRVAPGVPASLSRNEQAVWERINGQRNVRDLLHGCALNRATLTRLLLRLLATRALRRRVPPVALD